MRQNCPVACSEMKNPPKRKRNCVDIHENCKVWADEDDECERNSNVSKYCPVSCGKCKNDAAAAKSESSGGGKEISCEDKHGNCSFWAEKGECKSNPGYMIENCPKSCGKCKSEGAGADDPGNRQRDDTEDTELDDFDLLEETKNFGVLQVAEGGQQADTIATIDATIDYLEKSEDFLGLSSKIREKCKNKHELCSFWATIGECEKNKKYMTEQCGPACLSCHIRYTNN